MLLKQKKRHKLASAALIARSAIRVGAISAIDACYSFAGAWRHRCLPAPSAVVPFSAEDCRRMTQPMNTPSDFIMAASLCQ